MSRNGLRPPDRVQNFVIPTDHDMEESVATWDIDIDAESLISGSQQEDYFMGNYIDVEHSFPPGIDVHDWNASDTGAQDVTPTSSFELLQRPQNGGFGYSSEGASLSTMYSTSSPQSSQCSTEGFTNLSVASDKGADSINSPAFNDPAETPPMTELADESLLALPSTFRELFDNDIFAEVSLEPSPRSKKSLVPERAIGPLRQSAPPRQTCQFCGKTFSRISDMVRHEQDIHERGRVVYKCNGCKHGKFGRRDKMIEHCRTLKHRGFSAVDVSCDPETAAAVHSSCRRKKAGRIGRAL